MLSLTVYLDLAYWFWNIISKTIKFLLKFYFLFFTSIFKSSIMGQWKNTQILEEIYTNKFHKINIIFKNLYLKIKTFTYN